MHGTRRLRHSPGRTLSLCLLGGLMLAVSACGTQGAEVASPAATPGGASTSASSPSGPQPVPAPAGPTLYTSPPASPAADGAVVVQVAYAGGEVSGRSGRVEVPLGATVRLQVTSDTADEVHLHGYDQSVDVEPGAPAVLSVEATIPGVFEVELEELGVPLLSLQVQ